MSNYRDIPVEELLQKCKDKMRNGRTYDELRYFLELHKIDTEKKKYIFVQLEAFEIELANEPKEKKKFIQSPLNLLFGILLMMVGLMLITLGFTHGYWYYLALFVALGGGILVFFEIGKTMINQFKN